MDSRSFPASLVVSSLALAASALVGACAHAPAAAVEVPPPAGVTTATSAQPEPERAYRTVVEATACWSGGVWNDALEDSSVAPASRCINVLDRAYGSTDPVRLERLRALEPVEIHELADAVRRMAETDPVDQPRAAGLVNLLGAVANAEREEMLARRAAERVKMDTTGPREREKRTPDERAGASDLEASSALAALLALDAGDLSAEARTIAIMLATDRMNVAIDLPKHLKLLTMQGPFKAIFGVDAPAMPRDPAEHLTGGEWLGYLGNVAQAGGHPVPPSLTKLTDRERMAWGGALVSLSDRLRTERSHIAETSELTRVALGISKRLDSEYRASEAAVLSEAGGR